ncbi:MAG: biopolymer transporter ExbD [Pseudomonadota bacterium]|nr:biopolymer transporter ExbD [Pseudomonadota bacterium]
MRWKKTRASDNTFDINLAPVLDIIISIVSLLLFSVALIEIKMIETSVPQVVKDMVEKIEKQEELAQIQLKMSKKNGFTFEIDNKGNKESVAVPLSTGKPDYVKLQEEGSKIKKRYPAVFSLSVLPEKDWSMSEIVSTLDHVRKMSPQQTVEIQDPTNGNKVSTDFMFPNVVFANILGE